MSISAQRGKRQEKVFMKWCNSHLRRVNIEISDFRRDFASGVNLCHLYEVISSEKLPRWNKNPRNKIFMTNNLAIVVKNINKFVEEVGIRVQYSPQQIADGDVRSILGLLWILISKFVIPESEADLSAKRSLLRWVQRVTEPYDNVDVKNFHRSWKDGLAFNALLDQFDNSLMNYSALTPSDPAANLEQAFSIAEGLDIYRLLDVGDIMDFDVPDEKSVITYVSTMYQFFHKNMHTKIQRMVDAFNVDCEALIAWIKEALDAHTIPEAFPGEVPPCRELEVKLREFNKVKAQKANDKTQLYIRLADIQRRQRLERLKFFKNDDNVQLLHHSWLDLNARIVEYSSKLREWIMALEEAIRKAEEARLKDKEEREAAKREASLAAITEENRRREAEMADLAKSTADAEEAARKNRIALTDAKRQAENAFIQSEIERREQELKDLIEGIRAVNEEALNKRNAATQGCREAASAALQAEIQRRDAEEADRRENFRVRREGIIADRIAAAKRAREQASALLQAEIQRRDAEEAERRETVRKRSEQIIADRFADEGQAQEAERKKREGSLAAAEMWSRKAREDFRQKSANLLAKQAADLAAQRQTIREAKEATRAAHAAEVAAQIESELAKSSEIKAARQAASASERHARVAEKERVTREREDAERAARKKAREEEVAAQRAKEQDESSKLQAYDTAAAEFLKWVLENQAELTKTETRDEEEEDMSTEEDIRARRVQCCDLVKQKVVEPLRLWDVLVETGITEWASCHRDEVQYAADTMIYALSGDENENIRVIRAMGQE